MNRCLELHDHWRFGVLNEIAAMSSTGIVNMLFLSTLAVSSSISIADGSMRNVAVHMPCRALHRGHFAWHPEQS
jgi:hypothetical protein